MASDVIAAIATAPGRGGIGVVRVSGPGLRSILPALIGNKTIGPRQAVYTEFLDAAGEAIDRGLALYFPGPNSYTGEDVVELQGHGGPVVLNRVLQRCLQLGARIAEPGEFTKRAFLNEKIDLAQAEGVVDLIDAASEEAARCAMRSLQGVFSSRIDNLVESVTQVRMLIEATLDFPEEEIDALDRQRVRASLESAQDQVESIISAAAQGSLLREGIHVVIAGQPNVGKSSLLNALAGHERAIVTSVPGTTRDPIRELIVLDGIPVHVIDTAGLRAALDPVEQIGVQRAREEAVRAHLVLWVGQAERPDSMIFDSTLNAQLPANTPRIYVRNKIDLSATPPGTRHTPDLREVAVSARTGAGLDALRREVLSVVGWGGHSEGIYMARRRHLEALELARKHLGMAALSLGETELCAEELRLAQASLGTITGTFTADDLLGRIFSEFCIGK